MAQRILAVDDDPDVLLIIRTGLTAEGYEVQTASSGQEAVESAIADPPDLIILDVMMPGMSGFDVVRELKQHESTATIPIVMLTGFSERKRIEEALASGVNYYVVKPFDFEDLLMRISQALVGFE